MLKLKLKQAAKAATSTAEKRKLEEEEAEVLSLVAAHAFDPTAFNGQSGGATWDALWLDAASAVRACSKLLPGYHKEGTVRPP